MKGYLVIQKYGFFSTNKTKFHKVFTSLDKAEEYINNGSHKPICPVSKEDKEKIDKLQENIYLIMDNDAKFDNMDSSEIDAWRYSVFAKEGFSKDIIDKYENYKWKDLHDYVKPEIVEIEID